MKLHFIIFAILLFHADVGIGRTIEHKPSIELSPRKGVQKECKNLGGDDGAGKGAITATDEKKC